MTMPAVPTVNAAPPGVGYFPVPFALVRKTQELPQRLWSLEEDFSFYSAIVGELITAKKGFVTDGCSIPRLPGVYLLTGGKADEAGYIHDLLYTTQKYDRATCDRILREMVLAMGYSDFLADSMYLAVREFGGSHWNLPNVPQPAGVIEAP